MVMVYKLVFWCSVSMLFYIYAGYPCLVYLLSRWSGRPVRRQPVEPAVTVVIAAYNEQDAIGATVENKLAQDYPADRLDVLVVSDGSTDATDSAVLALAGRYPGRVRLLRQEPRAGKTAALNLALREVSREIVVFSDANSIYSQDAVRRIAGNFADPAVGYVTGSMIYVNDADSATGEGCSLYMRYENLLREFETGAGSVVGVDGGIDAVRKELYVPMRADQLPDFVLPLQVVARHYRVVYEPGALLREPALGDAGDEYRMRVRVALRALWALQDMRYLLNPFRYGRFSLQLLSHKVLRYLAFLFMLAVALSNALLLQASVVYQVTATLQLMLYALALAGLLAGSRFPSGGIFRFPCYFLLLNLASAQAFLKYLMRRKQVLWKPRLG